MFKQIDIKQINAKDRKFCFRYSDSDSKNLNLLNPIYVTKEKNDKYIIIDGFKRLNLYKKNKKTKIPAIILQDKEKQLFISSIRLNKFTIASDMDRVNIIYKLVRKFGCSYEECKSFLLPDIMTGLSDEIIEKSIEIYSMKKSLKDSLHLGQIKLMQAVYLLDIKDKQDRDFVFELVLKTGMNTNEQKKFMSDINVITKKQGKSKKEVFIDFGWIDIINDESLTVKNKNNFIKKQLQECRYPELSKTIKKINQKIKELKFPNDIKVSIPLNLEGDNINININVKEKQLLKKYLGKIKEKTGDIDNFFDYL